MWFISGSRVTPTDYYKVLFLEDLGFAQAVGACKKVFNKGKVGWIYRSRNEISGSISYRLDPVWSDVLTDGGMGCSSLECGAIYLDDYLDPFTLLDFTILR